MFSSLLFLKIQVSWVISIPFSVCCTCKMKCSKASENYVCISKRLVLDTAQCEAERSPSNSCLNREINNCCLYKKQVQTPFYPSEWWSRHLLDEGCERRAPALWAGSWSSAPGSSGGPLFRKAAALMGSWEFSERSASWLRHLLVHQTLESWGFWMWNVFLSTSLWPCCRSATGCLTARQILQVSLTLQVEKNHWCCK